MFFTNKRFLLYSSFFTSHFKRIFFERIFFERILFKWFFGWWLFSSQRSGKTGLHQVCGKNASCQTGGIFYKIARSYYGGIEKRDGCYGCNDPSALSKFKSASSSKQNEHKGKSSLTFLFHKTSLCYWILQKRSLWQELLQKWSLWQELLQKKVIVLQYWSPVQELL